MSNLQTIALTLSVFLFSLAVGLAVWLMVSSVTVVQSGNTGCIGFSLMEFEPETATLRVEFQNVYGQRPCTFEDHIGGK